MTEMDHLLLLIVVTLMALTVIINLLTIDAYYKMANSFDFAINAYVTFITMNSLFYFFGVIILLKYDFWNYGIVLMVLEIVLFSESQRKARYSKAFYIVLLLLKLFFLFSFISRNGGV